MQLVTTPFDAEPEAALRALADHPGSVLIDFDETLYLRNSTEDFLSSARPSLLAALLLRFLDALHPWQWTGGGATRDVWRVRAMSVVFPWTWFSWRRRVHALASTHSNLPLLTALASCKERVVVATIGFRPIVTPLMRAMGLQDIPLIAVDGAWMAGRAEGKLKLVQRSLGALRLGDALVLTDAAADTALLEQCATPLRTVWPAARFIPAHADVYLPGEYLSHVKRPGERYIRRAIIRQDFSCWVLCTLAVAPMPAFHIGGLLFLLISFWAVYELGYIDNDRIAARYETEPKLSAAFFTSQIATPSVQPWVWAAIAGAVGLWLLRYPARPSAFDFARWYAVLVTTFGLFMFYNRLNKATRVWLFWMLQLARAAGPLAVVPAVPSALVGLSAHVISRWLPYLHYRADGRWPKDNLEATRLLVFLLLAILAALTLGTTAVLTWTNLGFFIWALSGARHELRAIASAASRIDR